MGAKLSPSNRLLKPLYENYQTKVRLQAAVRTLAPVPEAEVPAEGYTLLPSLRSSAPKNELTPASRSSRLIVVTILHFCPGPASER